MYSCHDLLGSSLQGATNRPEKKSECVSRESTEFCNFILCSFPVFPGRRVLLEKCTRFHLNSSSRLWSAGGFSCKNCMYIVRQLHLASVTSCLRYIVHGYDIHHLNRKEGRSWKVGGIPAILIAMPLCCFARGTPLGVYGFFGGPDGGWDYRTWAVVRQRASPLCAGLSRPCFSILCADFIEASR